MSKISNKFCIFFTLIPYELWFIIVVAFSLRIYRLGYHDFWFDEIITLSKIYPLNFLKDWTQPLCSIILSGWVRIFGFSEISLRFPSLLFSLASIPVIFLLGKELFNKSAGLYASLIMALSPFQLWYAQEARAYSALLFFGLLSAYFQFLFIKRGQNKFLYWFAILSIIGFYTHSYYIFSVTVQLICYLIYSSKNRSARTLVVFMLILLSLVPLSQKYWMRLSLILKAYWIPPPNWKSFLITIENFNLGYNSHLLTYFIFNILSLILFVAAIWLVKQKRALRNGFIFCLILFVSPVLLAFIFSKLVAPIYLDRGLIVSTPYYYLILGLGISAFRKKILKFFVIISTLSLLIVGIYGFVKDWMPLGVSHHMGIHLKKPIKPVVEFIRKNSGLNDIIAFTNNSITLPFLWYSLGKDCLFLDEYKKKSNRYCFLFGPGSLSSSYRVLKEQSKFDIPFYKINELEFGKLWVLSCDWPRSGNLDKDSLLVKKWLDKNLKLELEREFDGLRIYRYAK